MKHTLVLPVSGGFMINQVAVFVKLYQKKYIPDIIMGSSGGAIVTQVICSAGTDQPYDKFLEKIKLLLSKIDSDNIYRTHPLAPITFDLIFRRYGLPGKYIFGRSLDQCYHQFDFNKSPELWIMGYSVDNTTITDRIRNQNHINNNHLIAWTNKHNPILSPSPEVLVDYINDSKELEIVVRGSSTLPIYTDPYPVKEHQVVDGGAGGPSPLMYFIANYRERIPLNIIYISPLDLEKSRISVALINIIFGNVSKMMSNFISSDMEIIEKMISASSNGKYSIDEGFLDDLSLDNNHTGSITVIYPLQPVEVNPFYIEVNTLNVTLDQVLTLPFRYKKWYF